MKRTCKFISFLLLIAGAGIGHAAINGVVTAGAWSTPIQESGKKTGGKSEYVCPSGQVMIGRKHKGDENGDTWYQCGTVSYGEIQAIVGQNSWSNWIQESGKKTGGMSDYQCPINTIMVGRSHKGDENGDTSYACAPLTLSGYGLAFIPQSWSAWIQESGKNSGGTSEYVCPINQIMISRKHKGDENGNTSYLCATVQWSASPVGTSAHFQSGPIQESGKKTDGKSSFTCPTGYLMTYRSHKGDENGDTSYLCRMPLSDALQTITVTPTDWSNWMQESGKKTGGKSSFACPALQAMIGREHKGDENGDTRYRCALVTGDGEFMSFTSTGWSDWIKESKSYFACPEDQFMLGREHKGDENGNTRYLCGYGRFPFQSTTLQTVLVNINQKVGNPATTDQHQFASRSDMRVDDDYYLHFDIGGEGYHQSSGVTSGFISAMNVNAQTDDSQPPYGQIPLLVHVIDWSNNPPYPIVSGTADYMTMQGAPLTDKNTSELARVLTPRGSIGLWVCPGDNVPGSSKKVSANLDVLASSLNSSWTYSCTESWSDSCPNDRSGSCDSNCLDEFNGEFGSPKICITDKR